MPRILALTIRPLIGPDTRYRIAQYIEPFAQEGLEVVCQALYTPHYYKLLSQPGQVGAKAWGLGRAWTQRLMHILQQARNFDLIWIGRELFPLGPPWLETLLFQRHSRVILDIDDALFLPDATNLGFIHRQLRDFGKLGRIAHKFKAIVCGNEFLASYFMDKNPHVHVIPTVVPMADYGSLSRSPTARPRIGWIGTPTNAQHLEIMRQPLQDLAHTHDFSLVIVGLSQPLAWTVPHMVYQSWQLDKELKYFEGFDIGIMPLYDSPFARGKCAFKIIQYMAAGIPVVASPVGSNLDVLEHGVHGFLADSPEQWSSYLTQLLEDQELGQTMGAAGRQTIADKYSLEGHWQNYATIIKNCL